MLPRTTGTSRLIPPASSRFFPVPPACHSHNPPGAHLPPLALPPSRTPFTSATHSASHPRHPEQRFPSTDVPRGTPPHPSLAVPPLPATSSHRTAPPCTRSPYRDRAPAAQRPHALPSAPASMPAPEYGEPTGEPPPVAHPSLAGFPSAESKRLFFQTSQFPLQKDAAAPQARQYG